MLANISRRKALQVGIGTTLFASQGITATNGISSPRNAPESPIHFWSLCELAERIRSKEISSVDATRHMLGRIESVDKTLKSYQLVTAQQALSTAKLRDRELAAGKYRGPLHGIPIGLKDLLFTKGIETAAGTRVRRGFKPAFDATVVRRLNVAGAVSLGKLALCEGAVFPYHPTARIPVNPWDADKWSGVSSSGSGVATAAGLCFASTGSDTGGSIRYPSAVNGCVGLKPTYGRVSRHGVFDLAASLDHIGPMTRTVEDTVVVFEAMAGHDPQDKTTSRRRVPEIRPQLSRSVKGLRIGLDRGYASNGVESQVSAGVFKAVDVLSRLGAKIVPIKMPSVEGMGRDCVTIMRAEAVLANKDVFPSRSEELGPGFRVFLEMGTRVTTAEFVTATQRRREATRQILDALSTVDCLACPSMSNPPRQVVAKPAELGINEWSRLNERDDFTKPFNLSGVPTLSLPCGFTSDGLPLSLQLVASPWQEAAICRAGHAYQQATQWHTKHPPV